MERFRFRRFKTLMVGRVLACLRGRWSDSQTWEVYRRACDRAAVPDPRADHPELEFLCVPGGAPVARLMEQGYRFEDQGLARDLTRGARDWAECFLVFRDRRLVHASQVATSVDNPELVAGMRSHAAPRAIFIGPCTTPASERGKGYYPLALRWICWHYGDQAQWAYIRSRTPASTAGILKAGFTPDCRIGHRRWLVFTRNTFRSWEAAS